MKRCRGRHIAGSKQLRRADVPISGKACDILKPIASLKRIRLMNHRPLRTAALTLLFTVLSFLPALASAGRPGPYVPLCPPRIEFSASYLAIIPPGGGSGYLFRIENHTDHAVRLAEPVPSSAHWYARVGSRWLWRASTGTGGSLVDATHPHGMVFAYRPPSTKGDPKYIMVPAHGSYEWTESVREDPVLAYRPGCAQCDYPGEHRYRAVFAYAWLPPFGARTPKHLLTCGLRTGMVVMPPKPRGKR